MGDGEQGFYRITTFLIEWQGRNAYAHIVVDITDDKKAADKLTSKAYCDPGTGIQNRLFFVEYMEKVLEEKRDIVLCYMDLDGLKYVNDRFGHSEGDAYIHSFVEAVQKSFRSMDVFVRIGGDEFCIVMSEGEKRAAEKRLADLLKDFVKTNTRPYPVSFSYGVVEIEGKKNSLGLKDIVTMADARMYECKKINKEK